VVQLNLGRAYAAKGDRDSLAKARQHLETSLNLNRDFVPAELALAGVQLELGENASAVRIAERLDTMPPQMPVATCTSPRKT
jgi:hypothetical protein